MNRLVVPIDPNDPVLVIGVFGRDYDWGSADDNMVMVKKEIPLPVDNWPGYEQEFTLTSHTGSADSRIVVILKSYLFLDITGKIIDS